MTRLRRASSPQGRRRGAAPRRRPPRVPSHNQRMPDFADDFLARFRWIDGHADMLGLLVDGPFLSRAVDALAVPFENGGITTVAAVEARGFAIGAGVALELGAGFVAIR